MNFLVVVVVAAVIVYFPLLQPSSSWESLLSSPAAGILLKSRSVFNGSADLAC